MEGYYIRIAPPPSPSGARSLKRTLPIKNRARDPCLPAEEQVSTDFLHLVRWGLRDANDPLVVDSVKVVDSQLGTQTPAGPAWRRYTGIRPAVGRVVWTPRFPVTELSAGIALRICLPEPANVHFGTNGWKDLQDCATRASGLGVHVADLPVARLGPGDRIGFTFFWPVSSQWEDRNYTVAVV